VDSAFGVILCVFENKNSMLEKSYFIIG
jgi:hypothetical protein